MKKIIRHGSPLRPAKGLFSKGIIIPVICLIGFAILSIPTSQAQFRQDRHDVEYMFKAEAGYMPFISNLGKESKLGYIINNMQHGVGLNIINGVNIKQDFFLGIGLGYNFIARPEDMKNLDINAGWHCPMAFVDFDFRPLDEEWAPMFGARLGASYLMSDGPYSNSLKPYVEVLTGINWFFRHEVRNMERNYMSLYLEAGIAYTQQTCYLPIRLGVRF